MLSNVCAYGDGKINRNKWSLKQGCDKLLRKNSGVSDQQNLNSSPGSFGIIHFGKEDIK